MILNFVHSVRLKGKPIDNAAVNLVSYWGDTDPAITGIAFYIQAQAAIGQVGTRISAESDALVVNPYQGLKLEGLTQYVPPAGNDFPAFRWNWWSSGFTANSLAVRNTISEYKIAIYDRDKLEINPEVRPEAGSIREAGQTMMPSGAHWVPTGYDVNDAGITQQSVVFTGDVDRFPNATAGLLPDGDYRVRVRIRDLYDNVVGPITLDLTLNRDDAPTGLDCSPCLP